MIYFSHSKGQTQTNQKRILKNKKICKQAVNFDLIYCSQDKNKTKTKGAFTMKKTTAIQTTTTLTTNTTNTTKGETTNAFAYYVRVFKVY